MKEFWLLANASPCYKMKRKSQNMKEKENTTQNPIVKPLELTYEAQFFATLN